MWHLPEKWTFFSQRLQWTDIVIASNIQLQFCKFFKKKKVHDKTDKARFIIWESSKVFSFLCQLNFSFLKMTTFAWVHVTSRVTFSRTRFFRSLSVICVTMRIYICFWQKASRFAVIVDGFLRWWNSFLHPRCCRCRDCITTEVLETIHCLKCCYLNVKKAKKMNAEKKKLFYSGLTSSRVCMQRINNYWRWLFTIFQRHIVVAFIIFYFIPVT